MLLIAWVGVFLFFWTAYYHFTKGQLTRHIGFLHYVIYFFAIYLGSLGLYLEGGSVNGLYLTSVLLYPLLSLLGMIWATILGGRVHFSNVEIATRSKDVRLVIGAVLLFLVVYVWYLCTLGANIPLLVTLRSYGALEGHVARYIATKGYREIVGGGIGFPFWFPRILIDYFGAFVAVFFFYHLRRRLADYGKFVLLVAGLFLIGVMANEKYPAVKLFTVLTLCFYNTRYSRANLRSLGGALVAAVAAIVFVGGVYTVVSGGYRELADVGIAGGVRTVIVDRGWALLADRGVVGQSMPLYMIYELIPRTYDFFVGRTFANPHGLLPYEPIALPYLIYESYHAPVVGQLRGADPTVFFGEIYANFGVIVSFFSMFLFGAILQIVNNRLSEKIDKYRTPFYIAFFYLIMIYLGDFAIGFTVPYLDERLLFFVGFYVVRRIAMKLREPNAVEPMVVVG